MIPDVNIKTIHIPPPTVKANTNKSQVGTQHSPPPTEPKKRMITTMKKWDFHTNEYTNEYQLLLLSELQKMLSSGEYSQNSVVPFKRIQLLRQMIHTKQYGYKTQDIEKDIFAIDRFISEPEIVDLLIASRLLCFYCRKEIQLLYEHVRETLQWSIERIDNKYGHNRDNVVIACLGCNLRRKTMYYERFRMTKQLNITKVSPEK
jgi:5-methylcytosine-specific restriction endonuclease McrA